MTDVVCLKCRTFRPGGSRTIENIDPEHPEESFSCTGFSPFVCSECGETE
jgi:hypothetical protein